MDAALDQIKQLATTAGEATRGRLMIVLRKMADSMESPNDTIHRYGHASLQTAAVQIGYDLGIFRLLVESGGPVTVEQVCQKTGAEEKLLQRVIRYLAAINAVDEVSKDQYGANRVTANLAEKVTEAGLGHFLHTVSPQYQALPGFLKTTGYKTPTDELHTAFQEAWDTSLDAFSWFATQPEHLAYFNDYMALRRQPVLTWLSVYPVEEEVRSWNPGPGDAIYVNVGGGIGHQCAEFKAKYPGLPGRVILQDLAHSIARALPTPGVENMVHDFLRVQPIKAAKFYHLRGILHDHPEHKGRMILERIKEAMDPRHSVLLIDEMIFPETGVSPNAASIDMTMLAATAGLERTEAQWRATLSAVGLELVKTSVYNPTSYEGVMHVRVPNGV